MTLLTLLITVLAVAVVTLTSVVFIRNTEHSKSDQLLLLLCETGERNLDYYFTSVEKSVKKIASFTEKDLDGLEDEKLGAHVERVKKYFDEIAGKTNGVLTYYYRIDPAVSENVKGFWFTNLNNTDFVEHEVTDITLYDTEDTSKLVWFTVPKHNGTAIWLHPYLTDSLDNVRVISYNMPIYFRGTFVGVIGIEIDHSTMAEQVSSIKLYNNGYAFLTDAEGSLVYHPKIDLATLTDETKPVMPEGVLSESTFTHYTFEGEAKEAAWLRLSNGMRLYVSVPESETEGDWQQLIRSVLLVAAAVVVLVIFLTYIVTRSITRPLKQLTEAALQADQGNYDFTLDYNGQDEVGVLTKTFKRMADHMKDHISDLNRRANVDALTSVRNKGAFASYIDEMQKKIDAGEETTEFAIGVFDCDDLKSVNDLYGHDKGDVYLKSASRVICRVFQHSPVFRIGGDEFAVVLRNDDFRYREELLASFEKATARASAEAENRWEQVHVAIGIAIYDPIQDHSVIDTMRRADKAMYVNKRKRKNGEA
jgi:diguanylate cyclase (GGDEF)-like protein